MTYHVSVNEPEGRWDGSRRVHFTLLSNDEDEISIEVVPPERGASWIAIVPTADLARALNDLDGFEVKYTPEREPVRVPTGVGAVVASPDRTVFMSRAGVSPNERWVNNNGSIYRDADIHYRLNRDEEPWQILSEGVQV